MKLKKLNDSQYQQVYGDTRPLINTDERIYWCKISGGNLAVFIKIKMHIYFDLAAGNAFFQFTLYNITNVIRKSYS